jgi:hypothetical protein
MSWKLLVYENELPMALWDAVSPSFFSALIWAGRSQAKDRDELSS